MVADKPAELSRMRGQRGDIKDGFELREGRSRNTLRDA
jgi:hypothetical protein